MSPVRRVRGILAGCWFFYRSFGALNFTLIVVGLIFLVGADILDLTKSREIVTILKRKEIPVDDAATAPNLEAWKDLETFEEREAYLQRAFDLVDVNRVRWQEERDRVETRLKAEKASLE